jgi:hypothetical protein
MSNELANIINQNPALIQTGLDEDTLAVAGGVSSGPKRISIKGGVFRKYAGGKEVGAIEDRHMNVIIVKMAHNASRMFYDQAYQEGVQASPVCWSSDSNKPDADVEEPKAKSCSECPYSVRNSAAANGKQCRLSWRTAVVLPDDPSGDVLQLVLPSTSCWQKEESGKWGFRPYVQMLANNNVAASRVITKMQFDTKSPVPKVLFSPIGAVNPDDYPIIEKQAQSDVATQAVKLSIYKPQEEVQAPAQPQVEAQVTETPQEIKAETLPQSDVEAEQPHLKETTGSAQKEPVDISNTIKKWSVKQ